MLKSMKQGLGKWGAPRCFLNKHFCFLVLKYSIFKEKNHTSQLLLYENRARSNKVVDYYHYWDFRILYINYYE
jgi:hypothetical protein